MRLVRCLCADQATTLVKDLRSTRTGLSKGQQKQLDQMLVDAVNAYRIDVEEEPGTSVAKQGGYGKDDPAASSIGCLTMRRWSKRRYASI